ncbi:RHS repeat-associated core domain-containing protein [Nocardiopsis protaetiae]|uniref:RHS repeat-associated core domain-containing protein n=1 Tax=Nocardiopsis protaetiae TaxID=3382270 RepID=UPI00387AD9E9
MSETPHTPAPVTRRGRKSLVSFVALTVAAGLASAMPVSALSYNPRPDVAEAESVDGRVLTPEATEADTTVADAAVTTLAEAEWPEADVLTLDLEEGERAPGGPVVVEPVQGEEFQDWDSPLPEPEEPAEDEQGEPDAGAQDERRLPLNPWVPGDETSPEDETAPTQEPSPSPTTEQPQETPQTPETPEVPEPEEQGDPATEEEPVEEAEPQPVSAAEVEILDRDQAAELGLSGLALRVTRTDGAEEAGPVRISVDYADFATAYGADYGSRLELLALIDCDPDTAAEDGCLESVDLESVNDTDAQVLSAVVPATAAGMMVTAAASGTSEEGTGDYTATSLSPSSTWNIGPQTGDFSWTYPMAAPNVAGGLKPEISLGYSSQSVDGRVSDTNNQTSWIGEGFDYHPGYIERRYATCQDDGTKIPDQCWSHHNATLNLGGRSTELVYKDGTWTPRNDDGSKVERLTGTTNGDNDGEYWKVTTVDGTQYFFGRNRLPGWASGKEETNSAWTVPVYGNDSGEPCHKSGDLAGSWCQQAWRWNLDYAVDAQGNALVHYYAEETNNYGRNFTSTATPYDRGGYLKRTEYGLRDSDPYATAPARVNYGVSERCTVTGSFDCAVSKRTEANADHWPDTPIDQECKTSCAGQHSPTFWTTKKLDSITTQVHNGTAYTTVDSWKLTHTFPDPGDGTDPALWLDSITHTGHVGGTKAYPAITFAGQPLPNRVDSTTDGLAPMNKWRITAVYTETGGQVNIRYLDSDCEAGKTPRPHENTKACFPVIRAHQGGADDITDWFAKYRVAELVEVDLVTDQPDVITTYDYVGKGAWRYMDDDGFVEEDKRTWSQWRGYDRVIVRTGHPDETRTETEHLFYQGMNGDKLPSGTRTATVTDSTGTSVTDDVVFSGQTREVIVRNGVGGQVVSRTITTPWKRKTADSSHSWDTRGAHMTNTERVDNYTRLASGSFRHTRTANTFDSYGMIATVHDQGDVADPTDDKCTATAYARNTGRHLLNLVSHTRTTASTCGGTPSADRVISDVRVLYDGKPFGEAPTQGRPTQTQRAVDYNGSTPVYQTVTTTTFDTYGRALTVADAAGNTTTTKYTAAQAGGHDIKVETTNALGHVGVQEFDARSQPIKETNAAGGVTHLVYDPLGRLTDVWLPDRNRTATASMRFEYNVAKNAPTTVVTHTLNPHGRYVTSYKILDGFLRERQTQAPAPNGGRVITDVFRDTRGNTVIEREPYYNTADPAGALFVVNNHDEIPRWTRTVYDGADRATDVIQMSRGLEQRRTTTAHHGDRTLITVPDGGTGTTSIIDARGQIMEVRKHHGEEPTGEYDTTAYTYTSRGELATVTDPGGSTWGYTYDLLGRKVSESDPDTGVTTTVYDDLDRVVSVTDARGQTLHTTYDALGRKTHLREGSASGTVRASWVYDTVMKGQLSSATRHHDGSAYTTRILGYDPVGRPRAQQIIVPASEGGLAGTYQFGTLYNPDGTVASISMPATGGLGSEAVSYGYDELGNPTTLTGNTKIVTESLYSKVGDLVQREFHRGVLGANKTWQTFAFDEKTDRLTMAGVVPQIGEGSLSTQTYAYDDIGNLLRINDEPTDPQRADDVQCFTYDHLRRLTEVWTPGATGGAACAEAPSAEDLGGAAPYWHSYTYDATGNRIQEIQHHSDGGQTVRDYTTPGEGEGPEHAITRVDQQGIGGATEHVYDYDAAGNMVRRTTGEHDQTLQWGPEGELVQVTDGLAKTAYVYDANGERLLRRANGATTLYLPGSEITWDPAAGTKEGTRYYTHADETVAIRENDNSLHWVFSDHHGTGQLTVNAMTGEVVQRRMTVFGESRGSTGEWPGERGFVNGMVDASTGLTQLGARAYDAALGRFISVDPLMNLTDAQTLNGYAYANNSPATYWDGTGLSYCTPSDGICMEVGGNTTVSYKKKNGQSGIQTWNHKKGTGWRQISYTQYRPVSGGRYETRRQSGGSSWSSWRVIVKRPVVNRAPVDYTRSPQEQALDDANWFQQRYSNSQGGLNWGNVADDIGMVMGVAGLFGCAVCAGISAGIGLVRGVQKIMDGDNSGYLDAFAVGPFGAVRWASRGLAQGRHLKETARWFGAGRGPNGSIGRWRDTARRAGAEWRKHEATWAPRLQVTSLIDNSYTVMNTARSMHAHPLFSSRG